MYFGKVQRHVDTGLNRHKNNFFYNRRDNFKDLMSIDQILESLEITKFEYEQALSSSGDNSFQIHFKRETNFCFVYNYFADGLLAWVANMDIQPMLNQHKAVAKLYAKLKCVHTYQRLRMNIYILRMKRSQTC